MYIEDLLDLKHLSRTVGSIPTHATRTVAHLKVPSTILAGSCYPNQLRKVYTSWNWKHLRASCTKGTFLFSDDVRRVTTTFIRKTEELTELSMQCATYKNYSAKSNSLYCHVVMVKEKYISTKLSLAVIITGKKLTAARQRKFLLFQTLR